MRRYFLASLMLMTAVAIATPAVAADDFPTKPIKFLIPFNPGGQSDVAVLLLRPGLEEHLKVNMVPQYQPGGGGAVGWTMLSRAPKDGYMMAVTNLPHILVQPLVTKGVEYKTADLSPVYLYATTPGGIAVKADDERFKTLQDLIEYAKQNPQKLSIGGTGKFTGNHLGYLQFTQDAAIDTTYVSFNGAAPQTAAILGGHVDAIYGGTFIFSNNPEKLRVLALATEERLEGFPGVPTFKELGIDLIQGIDRGVTVPAGTSPDRIDKLAEALRFAAARPEFKDGMQKAGFELLNLGPDEFAAFIEAKTQQYMEVLKKADLLN
jgi:tripartite-type tricarboxylate transporter receptor subunit TctC